MCIYIIVWDLRIIVMLVRGGVLEFIGFCMIFGVWFML